MRTYELIAMLSPKKQTQKSLEALEGILSRHQVRTSREEKWGEKKLFHPIKDIKKAFFVYKNCNIDPTKIQDLSRDMNLDAHILRFMLKLVA